MSKSNLFAPIASRRIFEEVSDRIKQLLFDGTLKPGDQLPTETQLADQFHVSRPTIREALRLLEVSGFISISKGGTGGPVITDTIFHRISQLYLDAFRMKRVTLPELTVARLDIEKNVLNHLFERRELIDEDRLNALRANIRAAQRKVARGIRATEENLEFHRLLATYTDNHVYVIILESVMAMLGDMLSRLAPDVEAGARVVSEHERILDAIAAREPEKALAFMESHLLDVESRLRVFAEMESRKAVADGKNEGRPKKRTTQRGRESA